MVLVDDEENLKKLLQQVTNQMYKEFIEENKDRISICIAAGAPLVIKDGKVIKPSEFYKERLHDSRS